MYRWNSFVKLFSVAVLVQCILFLPLYITRYEEGTFLPSLDTWPSAMVSRTNPDIFRFCLEWSILFIIYIWLGQKFKSKMVTLTLTALYIFLCVFQIYYYLLWKIYGEIPIFADDFALFERVLPVFLKTMHIKPFFFYITLFIILYFIAKLFYFIFNKTLELSKNCKFNQLVLLTFFYSIFPILLKSNYTYFPDSNSSKNAIVWVSQNMYKTFTQTRVKRLPDTIPYQEYRVYDSLRFKSKPSIYLIFIEAYGSIIGSVEPYASSYKTQLKTIESDLEKAEWKSVSTLSNSPILGGRSWLGFTSLLAGIRINNHSSYEKLIRENPGFPHLIELLNKNGYNTYRLNTMASANDKDFNVIDSMAQSFFKIKTWTRFRDIPYLGYKYDYFGGIPDQYALNYWHENVLKKDTNSDFLFFITLNTHAPFYLPPPVLNDWKKLDTIQYSPHKGSRLEKGSPISRYALEVKYILTVLKKYILEQADPTSLFILVGDHQPAGMEYMLQEKTDVYATTMHIITKDSLWTKILENNGFNKGMTPAFSPNSLLNHEGFYSFFIHAWATRDSLHHSIKILKNGIEY